MSITCRAGSQPHVRLVTVSIAHHHRHPKYLDVSMPPEALDIIRDNLEWSTPSEIARRVKSLYPAVTSVQVHHAWTELSEVSWKRGDAQLPSAEKLLKELAASGDVDIFQVEVPDGVEMVCWGF